jgi:hypothetical protein
MILNRRVACAAQDDAERSREQSATDARANIAESAGAHFSAADSMIPSTPMRPAPPSDPPASRRATLVLNLALVAVAAIVVLSNLLFFPLGPGANRRSVEEKPAASAPVVVALPVLKQPVAPAESPVERGSATPPAMPAVPPVPERASAGAEDAAVLQRIEPTAAPPVGKTPEAASEPTPAAAPQSPAAPVPAVPPQIVASLPPANEPAPAAPPQSPAGPAPSPPPQTVASLPPPNEPVPAAPPPARPVETAATSSVETASAPPAASPLSQEEIEALTRRGDALLVTGDIIAARFAFERAARAGSAAAATGVGKTFDPLFLAAAGVRGIQGNPFEAAAWYRRGSAAGDREAEARLHALHLQFPE